MIKIFNNDCLEFLASQNCLDLFKNKKIVIVTDPPFNIRYHYKNYKDNLLEEEYMEWLETIFTSYNYNGIVVIHYPETLYKISFQIGLFPEKVISWVYNSNNFKQHRDIAFFKIKPDLKKVTQDYKNPNDKRIKKMIEKGKTGARLYDWWNINQVKNISKEKTNHPCQMPLKVMENIIGILPEDVIIFDPFMGSGTTGVACKKLNRNFIGCELDKEYFEIARKRIEEQEIKQQSIFDFIGE